MKSSSCPITSLRHARSTFLQLLELFAREVEAFPVNVLVVRSPADGGLLAQGAAVGAIDDPLEDAHVFAEAGPENLPSRPCGTS
jgi:hypothetical protein